MKRFAILWVAVGLANMALGQVPQVPRRVQFADMTLTLTDAARREIQEDVESLHAGITYLQEKADRARLYMPIVEQIMREEGVPEDFKFLAIQESAFVPDAVSTSNAIGFWQFKEPSAFEVGLKINRQVDERMNIVSATRGACRYLKSFNETFDNWWYSLQAYNNGFTGAQNVLPTSGYGKRTMQVTKQSHWYIKKYLAHRIAYTDAVEPLARPARIYALYETEGGESLNQLSRQLGVDGQEMKDLNIWLKSSRVPDDKNYFVLYPIDNPSAQDLQVLNPQQMDEEVLQVPQPSNQEEYPIIFADKRVSNQPFRITINGKRAIVAGRYDDIHTLASKAEILPEKLRELNDMDRAQAVIPGQYYYLENKRNRARVYYHTVQPEETLWLISQKYGVKLNRLVQKNRLTGVNSIEPGMLLWLRFIRPADIPVQYDEEIKAANNPNLQHNEEMIAAAISFLDQEGPETEVDAASTLPTPATLPPPVVREIDTVVEQDTLLMLYPATAEPEATSEEILMAVPEEEEEKEEVTPILLYPAPKEEQEEIVAAPQDTSRTNVILAVPSEFEVATTELDAPATTPSPTENVQEDIPIEDVAVLTMVSSPGMDTLEEEVFEEESDPILAPSRPDFHSVQQGETLYGIARLYEIPFQRLVEYNQLDPSTPIDIDQKLKIPPKSAENAENPTSENSTELAGESVVVHEVQAGETMYSLARQYSVKVEDIRHWNEKPDYTLKVGEKLIIKR
ncbi:MAG: LysM peptidoglycan-binding domain-containing protein [Bacteroidota bacterium]